MIVWLNGALTGTPAIDPADRGFTLGDGLFETMALEGGVVRRLDRHVARLHAGLAVIGMVCPDLTGDAVARAAAALTEAHGVTDGVLRLTVSRGVGGRGLALPDPVRPTRLMTLAPASHLTAPLRLGLATVTRRNEFSPLSRIKSLGYLDGILARAEALGRGFDDSVLLNTQGRVAETPVATLFVAKDGRLATPPLGDGALPGVARAVLLDWGGAVEAPIEISDLIDADEIVVTNALGARGVSAFEGHGKTPGPVLDHITQCLRRY